MKRGFTLIELLAVIVILAIIALIAIPIVINIIAEVGKSSDKESIKLYIDTVQKEIAHKQLLDNTFSPEICEIGNKKLMCDGVEVEIAMKGDIPSEGTLYFTNGKMTIGENILLKDLYYQIENGEIVNITQTSSSKFSSVIPQIEKIVGNVTGTCTITNTNKITCGNEEKAITKIGQKIISEGVIVFSNGKIISYKNVNVDDLYYHKKEGQIETITKVKVYLCTKENVANNINITKGDKYTCEVKDNTTYTFYILTQPSDGKVNLIMDRNICNDGNVTYTSTNNYCKYQWHAGADNNNYGPDTAMQQLYEGTKGWTNVPDMIMNYTDENNTSSDTKGYTGIITNTSTKVTTIIGKNETPSTTIGTSTLPLKARLPRYDEITEAGCSTTNGSCPIWLMENMKYYNVSDNKYSINNNSEACQNYLGYWLLASTSNSAGYANNVYYFGKLNGGYSTYGNLGVRPVITVSPSDLSN